MSLEEEWAQVKTNNNKNKNNNKITIKLVPHVVRGGVGSGKKKMK